MKHAVQAVGVDDGGGPPRSLDGERAVDVEIAGRRRVLALAGDRERDGSGGKQNRVGAGSVVRRDDRFAQRDAVAAVGRDQAGDRRRVAVHDIQRVRDGDGGEDAVPVGLRQGDRFDVAEMILERPVAAERRGPGEIRAGRDVVAGPGVDLGEQRLAGGVGRQVAAVEQQIAMRDEGVAPMPDLIFMAQGRGRVEREVAEADHPSGAVRNDVDRVEIAPLRQGRTDDRHAVFIRMDVDDVVADIIPARQIGDKLLVIGHRRIDEDQVVADRRRVGEESDLGRRSRGRQEIADGDIRTDRDRARQGAVVEELDEECDEARPLRLPPKRRRFPTQQFGPSVSQGKRSSRVFASIAIVGSQP